MSTQAKSAVAAFSVFAIIVLFFATMESSESRAQALLNFERFKGHWTGSGSFIYSDGRREDARCQINVRSYGRPDRGGMDIECAAGTYRIAARAFDVTLEGPKVAGAWELSGFGLSGALGGRVSTAKFDVVMRPECHSACNFDPLSRGIGVQN